MPESSDSGSRRARLHDALPETAFIDPHGSNRDAVDRLFRQVIGLLLDYASTSATRSPLPNTAATLDYDRLLAPPASERVLLNRLQTLMEASVNLAHPGYLGHMDPMPTTASLLGALVAATLNNNMLLLELSPVLSRLERRLAQRMARHFGLGEAAGGVMASGGTLANLHALAVARNVAYGAVQRGITRLERQPVVLASAEAHLSIQKAGMVLGLGTDAVLPVPTTADAQMDPAALESTIAQARERGQHPFCVVGTAGTTVTGNMDPLVAIARTARAQDLWFHVDAAYGGYLVFSTLRRRLLQGIEHADSITFNPQKGLQVARTSAMVLFRDAAVLEKAFRRRAAYAAAPEGFTDLGEISVQGTRAAEVLKLWLSLQHLGETGYAHLIDASYDRTARFVAYIQQRPFLEMATTPETNIVCFRGAPFRGAPGAASETDQDAWNTRLHTYLLRECDVFLSLPTFQGRRWLRAVLLNPYTDEAVFHRLFEGIDTYARKNPLP